MKTVKIKFPDGFSVDDAFNLSGLSEEGRLNSQAVYDKNGRLIYFNVRKRPRPTLEELRERIEEQDE